ncbi:MAG: 4-hydroxy-tetrahydrodipicolinate reductase [Cytophagales bacterium]
MKILLIGYGKMGKAIEGVAAKRGHQIVGKIDVDNAQDLRKFNGENVDAAIEFTHPSSAFANLTYSLESNIPIVCGTTGWLDQLPELQSLMLAKNGSLCYSSNYSIGVNLFWAANIKLAQLMNLHEEYDVTMEEIHHVYKKDAPSGTAITTADDIVKNLDRKQKWSIDIGKLAQKDLFIDHKRIHNIPGTHTVLYTSGIDSIQLTHTAFNREGFATGAVVAAEYICKRKGFFTMKEVLSL